MGGEYGLVAPGTGYGAVAGPSVHDNETSGFIKADKPSDF